MTDYKEKEMEMIKALDSPKGHEMFDSKDEGLEFLADNLSAFPEYVNTVARMQVMMPIWRNRYEGQELRDKIQDIDSLRRSQHNRAIDSVNILNRFCKNFGMPAFAEIDTSDRYAVADFAGMWTLQMYNDGIGKTMDEAVMAKDGRGFDDKSKERLMAAYDSLGMQSDGPDAEEQFQ